MLTWFTAGLTKRWTITFPMVPLIFLQEMRRLRFFQRRSWGAILVGTLSTALLSIMIALCIAFPAVQPPPIQGPYHVGVVDLQMPVNLNALYGTTAKEQPGFVAARILYPTMETGAMPYLKAPIASEYLKQSIRTAAPPPINAMAWFLDNWKLIRLDSKEHAKPASTGTEFPLAVFSHGLGGSAAIYSHQTRSLVANGYIVIAIDHSDGSNPAVMKKDGSVQLLDFETVQLFRDGKKVDYARARRDQTEWRARELAAAAVALQQLNVNGLPELKGVSFMGLLDTTKLVAMGHSFGGSTALTVAVRRPDIIKAVVAHEPATDWSPDDVRTQIYPRAAIGDWKYDGAAYDGGTGGVDEVAASESASLYEYIPVLYLFSDEWYGKNWGYCRFLEYLHKKGSLGKQSEFGVIAAARHNEFSDMCFLTPLWLARSLNVTGVRSPINTATEIVDRTLAFLQRTINAPSSKPNTKTKNEQNKPTTTAEL